MNYPGFFVGSNVAKKPKTPNTTNAIKKSETGE
jgi:hypothetical protein